MTGRYYILEGTEVVPVDLLTWALWFEMAGASYEPDAPVTRRVAAWRRDDVSVSTIFLGLDCQLEGGPPLLFETLVRGGEHDQYMERYATWAEAFDGHIRIVRMVR